MSSRSRRQSEKSNGGMMDVSKGHATPSVGLAEMEYFWSIELNADKKSFTWMNTEDMEEDDEDFIEHTLFLKTAALGENSVPKENNLIMVESSGSDGEKQKGVIVSLANGQQNMCSIDLSVSGKVGPTTFTLVEGSGPIFLSGNLLMEYPKEDSFLDNSQTESEEEETEEEEAEEEEVDEKEADIKAEDDPKKAVKRKAGGAVATKSKQKAKMEDEEDDADEIDEEDEEDDEEDEVEAEEEEEEESEEEVKTKTKKRKDAGKKDVKAKAVKKPPPKKSKK